ncbi:MAG: ATP-binding protein [Proteobacteria bacterium]|nr:ATP-binding protein [Pseudomonadota bacterium]
MSNFTSTTATLELLHRLREAVRIFVTREDQLQREQLNQSARLTQRGDAVVTQRAAQLQGELTALENALNETRAGLVGRWDGRQARLIRAQKNSLRQQLTRIEERENLRKFELQREMLNAQRRREAGLKAASAAHVEFTAQLKVEQERLVREADGARVALRGYGSWKRLLSEPGPVEVAAGTEPDEALAALREQLSAAADEQARVRAAGLPLVFSFVPVWVWAGAMLLLVGCFAFLDLSAFGVHRPSLGVAGIAASVGLALVGLVHLVGRLVVDKTARALATALGAARQLATDCERLAKARRDAEEQRVEGEVNALAQRHEDEWQQALAETEATKLACKQQMEARLERAMRIYHSRRAFVLERFERATAEQLAAARSRNEEELQHLTVANETAQMTVANQREGAWVALAAEWRAAVGPLYAQLGVAQRAAARSFPGWSADFAHGWKPPEEFAHAVPFARLEVDVMKLAGAVPRNPRLALPGPAAFSMPLLLTVPELGSLLVETKGEGRDQAIATLNNTILRLLVSAPPGRLSFTLLDPVELGRSFSGLMHLGDYDERLINSRIWTQSAQIEQQLGNLNEHIEKVSQMYLRNEFATVVEYNEQAGRIAERYHFLVVADFPAGFSDAALRRLASIAASGARCGVFLLFHWDQRKTAAGELVPEDLRAGSISVRRDGNVFFVGKEVLPGLALVLEPPPSPEIATELLHKVGQASVDSSRVQVPFADIAPPAGANWTVDTGDELRISIGRTGATKLQYLCLGKGTRQHALVAGKTGSGKSTLFHAIITNLALWCSPEQVEFYLVDFKKGVEFRCYAAHRLPHARVVAIESDREFGLSVLERLDEELKRRGELFRKVGAQDLPGYRRASGGRMPRTLLLIDEFQEFFVADDRVAQGAALLLDRIVRQGRAFGIHVILGSQTLGGAYSLARATLGQMVVRIALQCNEADAALIMDDTNPAPRLLSRPGEAIYNDEAGAVTGNSPFQTVWLDDEERDRWLSGINELTRQRGLRTAGTVVFEGNSPADVRENAPLAELLAAPQREAIPRAWLGAPNSIKGPTEAAFHRQSGNNLLLVGQREEAALAMIGVSLVAFAAQGAGRLVLIEATAPDSPQKRFLESVGAALPTGFTLVRAGDLETVMVELAGELSRRTADENVPAAPWFVFVHELQKFKKLRHEEDFSFSTDDAKPPSPGAVFDRLITEGPGAGIHVFCTCDSYNSLSRALSRKAISEFELRVLFQMSANDSATLCDSPKASDLGLHRALLNNGQQGVLETFRPYALPDAVWLEEAGRSLRAAAASSPA